MKSLSLSLSQSTTIVLWVPLILMSAVEMVFSCRLFKVSISYLVCPGASANNIYQMGADWYVLVGSRELRFALIKIISALA